MKRLGLVLVASLACNSGDEADTDSGNNSGSGGSSSSSTTDPTMSATASETANTDTASGSGTTSAADGSTTSGGDSSTGGSSGGSSSSEGGSSSSTGEPDAATRCENTGGTWDEKACDHYVCGEPNDCEALIPGCDCGTAANFVEGEGCVSDPTCTFDCKFGVECSTALEYCLVTFPAGGGNEVRECIETPKVCVDMVDCDCVVPEIPAGINPDCTEVTDQGLIIYVDEG